MPNPNLIFDQLIQSQKAGLPVGIPSICSSHPFVIQAAFEYTRQHNMPALIESTCNQVNQFGGYTGKTPAQFIADLYRSAQRIGLPRRQLILGGDHLGPYPWRDEPLQQAMQKSRTLVKDYVQAGYTKIHLDASMHCADDDLSKPLDTRLSAERTAELALVAETTIENMQLIDNPLRYVIGTEVPTPGGILEKIGQLAISTVEHVQETIQLSCDAFQARGLEGAWQRVIAVVVHPGVEFGDDMIYPYNPAAARDLTRFIETQPNLVFEAHSTDYQTAAALQQMVADHFAILKVGPALTFAMREALFALEMIEEEYLGIYPEFHLSHLRQTLEEAMLHDPAHWVTYYPTDPEQGRFARSYSYSDRIRYYWMVETVQQSVNQLIHNLMNNPPPLVLLSQYMPGQYEKIRAGELSNKPDALVINAIEHVLEDYGFACGYTGSSSPGLATRA